MGGYTTEQVTYSGVPAGYTVSNQGGYTTGTTYSTGPVKTSTYEYTTGPAQTYEYTTGPVQTYEYTTEVLDAGKEKISRQYR